MVRQEALNLPSEGSSPSEVTKKEMAVADNIRARIEHYAGNKYWNVLIYYKDSGNVIDVICRQSEQEATKIARKINAPDIEATIEEMYQEGLKQAESPDSYLKTAGKATCHVLDTLKELIQKEKSK